MTTFAKFLLGYALGMTGGFLGCALSRMWHGDPEIITNFAVAVVVAVIVPLIAYRKEIWP